MVLWSCRHEGHNSNFGSDRSSDDRRRSHCVSRWPSDQYGKSAATPNCGDVNSTVEELSRNYAKKQIADAPDVVLVETACCPRRRDSDFRRPQRLN